MSPVIPNYHCNRDTIAALHQQTSRSVATNMAQAARHCGQCERVMFAAARRHLWLALTCVRASFVRRMSTASSSHQFIVIDV